MSSIILPYVNPDLDGVACSIAISELEGPPWSPCIFGRIDSETSLVLDELKLERPSGAPKLSEVRQIWLVDTHHPDQLPTDLPFDRVMHITDHHPDGSPDSFPNAKVQNEPVGAAATLVAERFAMQIDALTRSIAVLLQAAIYSNTLGFRAPATSERDRSMFQLLGNEYALPNRLKAAMDNTRKLDISSETHALLDADVKVIAGQRQKIAISQIEASGALALLERDDLIVSLERIGMLRGTDFAILNLVDLNRSESAVIVTQESMRDLLAEKLGVTPDRRGVLLIPQILQRKTDIVPFLI